MNRSLTRTLAAIAFVGVSFVAPGQAQITTEDQVRLKALPVLFKALDARPGARIADVGSGDGFYSLQIAAIVAPGGRVTATDIDEKALTKLKANIESGKVTNVDVVQGRADDPLLEANTFDAALIRNAYHEMTEHQAMLRHIREALKPGGRLVIADRVFKNQREANRSEQTAVHQLSPEFVEADLLAAGFQIRSLNKSFEPVDGDPANPGAYWLIVAIAPAKGAPTSVLPSTTPTPSARGG